MFLRCYRLITNKNLKVHCLCVEHKHSVILNSSVNKSCNMYKKVIRSFVRQLSE